MKMEKFIPTMQHYPIINAFRRINNIAYVSYFIQTVELSWIFGKACVHWHLPQFASKELCHNPPLPGVQDHALPLLNHDLNQSKHKPTEHWCHSMILLLLYDKINSLVNFDRFLSKLYRWCVTAKRYLLSCSHLSLIY